MKSLLLFLAGTAIASALFTMAYFRFDLGQTKPSPYDLPTARWTSAARYDFEDHHQGNFVVQPTTGDYFICEPKVLGYDDQGKLRVDDINRTWVVYHANHDRTISLKGCWSK